MSERTGWFADIDPEAEASYMWQPCLQLEGGHCPSFQIWFEAEQECLDWIRENVIGQGLIDPEVDEQGKD